MFLCISSDAATLYKRNILDVLCYPEGQHIVFRYQSKYVNHEILASIADGAIQQQISDSEPEVLIVYAQKPTAECPKYAYSPVRYGRLSRIYMQGTIVFVEICLARFANLSMWRYSPHFRERFEQSLVSRPGAVDATTFQGYFFDTVEDDSWGIDSAATREGADWESVVDELSALPSMKNCLFYRVRGFFRPSSSVDGGRPLGLVTKHGTAVVPIPMSQPIDLKLFFYRPSGADPGVLSATLEVSADKDGFSQAPNNRIDLAGRYDDVTIRLASKRVFESILAPVSVKLVGSVPSGVLASEPTLMCTIDIPGWVMAVLLVSLLAAPLFLSLSADDLSCWAERIPGLARLAGSTSVRCDGLKWLAGLAKLAGAGITAIAGYIIFRRWPVSK